MVAARATEEQTPERVSGCTGASTTHCETHSALFSPKRGLFMCIINSFWGCSLAEMLQSDCQDGKLTSAQKYRLKGFILDESDVFLNQ